MKGDSLILAFLLRVASCRSAAVEVEGDYPTCGILSTFTMKSAPSEVHSGDEFAFRLSTGFNNYTALCSGKWQYDWTVCADEDEDRESIAMFRGTASGYLDITHRYPCKRLEEPHDIALGIANGTVILDFSEKDTITLNAFITTSHRKPNRACTDASQHPKWVVDGFLYEVGVINIPPNGPGGGGGPIGATAGVSFDLYNKANDWSIHCSAAYVSGSLDMNNDTIIDPNRDWPCPFPSNNDLVPKEDYPTTSFRFDKAKRQLTVQQQWECDDYSERCVYVRGTTSWSYCQLMILDV
ncbi:hypothetical protein F5Y04DRAFT_257786 [Hypomontagnella monticulosa]|nr:hypothetical protein F5Y04DRAFT_257786 [Hypomontagnella monticulosa]